MRILSVSNFPLVWGKNHPNVLDQETGGTVGGGEEAFLRTAAGLRALGHEVRAVHFGHEGVWEGVPFYSHEGLYIHLATEPYDAVVSWSSIKPLTHAAKTPVKLFAQQLNDLMEPGHWDRVTAVVSPSYNHAEMVREWGWNGPRHVCHNGVTSNCYTDAPPFDNRPFNVGYWSSPDRGLHHLLRAWPEVVRLEPRARLHVFYEIDKYIRNTVGIIGHFGFRAQEVRDAVFEARADKTVTFHGAVPRKELFKWQKQTRVQCFPFDPIAYTEGFGIAVNQGLDAGCRVLLTRHDAFPTLYGDSPVEWIDEDFWNPNYSHYLAITITDALHGPAPRPWTSPYTWQRSSLELEAACAGRWNVQ